MLVPGEDRYSLRKPASQQGAWSAKRLLAHARPGVPRQNRRRPGETPPALPAEGSSGIRGKAWEGLRGPGGQGSGGHAFKSTGSWDLSETGQSNRKGPFPGGQLAAPEITGVRSFQTYQKAMSNQATPSSHCESQSPFHPSNFAISLPRTSSMLCTSSSRLGHLGRILSMPVDASAWLEADFRTLRQKVRFRVI